MEENRDKWFSEQTYAVPFGRFQAGGETDPPADEVLVGRNGQRAYFLDILLRAGRQGAFLVTGSRGMGKSSFVRYCLDEYRHEVFDRFIHSNVGRATFWDRAMVFGLASVFLLCAVLLSEIMGVLVSGATNRPGTPDSILLWLAVALPFLLCLYPILFAREVLAEALEVVLSSSPANIRNGDEASYRLNPVHASLIVVGLAWVFWRCGPFGAPAITMARLLVSFCATYLWVQCASWTRGEDSFPALRKGFWEISTVLFFLLAGYYVVMGMSWIMPDVQQSTQAELWINLKLGALLFGWGAVLQGIGVTGQEGDPSGSELHAKKWYLSVGSILFLGGVLGLLSSPPSLRVGLGIIVVAALIYSCYYLAARKVKEKNQKWKFMPRPLLALTLKVILSLIVALQLAYPVFAALGPRVGGWLGLSSGPRQFCSLPSQQFCSLQVSTIRQEVRAPISLIDVSRNEDLSTVSLFSSHREEMLWILGLLVNLSLLYFLDYDWIVRPLAGKRQDRTIKIEKRNQENQGNQENLGNLGNLERDRRISRRLAAVTLPWFLYRAWLPVLVVSVNLGFEKLDHRRVVQAMLAGLRERYQRTFLSWNSGPANAVRILVVVLLFSLVGIAGKHWFFIEGKQPVKVAGQARDTCDALAKEAIVGSALDVVCRMPSRDLVFHLLYFDLLHIPALKADGLLMDRLLPYREQPLLLQGHPWSWSEPGIFFRVYHLLMFIVFFLLGSWIFGHIRIFPYHDTLARIDEVMDRLTSSTSVTSKGGQWQLARWVQGLVSDEKVRQVQQEPLDPRTVEFVFLQILGEIQEAALRLPGGRSQFLSLPVPEITFVFDELDKLGTRVDPTLEDAAIGKREEVEILNAERRRSGELYRLLADMKNLLSSAPARFIFVGGRNLHDEWLADQTARQPLLTNIFNGEVYLPSLLTDYSRRQAGKLEANIELYLAAQIERGKRLHARHQRKMLLPSLALSIESRNRDTFLRVADAAKRDKLRENLIGYLCTPAAGVPFPAELDLSTDFIQFVSFRSLGNPKRLKELLGFLVRPVLRVAPVTGKPEGLKECHNVLAFDDTERFRIQLLADVYRHLMFHLREGLVRRDDKILGSVIHLSNFFFKFHRRAFSWKDLERVEDLAHIHREPDLREILNELVGRWTDRFLHHIRNGMYDFRFRSGIARELDYLSRQSPEEMAVLNFTLDESQALKSVYESKLRRLEGAGFGAIQDLVVALAQLYEFDQEYETARFRYRHAVTILDRELSELAGGMKERDSGSPMLAIISGSPEGRRMARLHMTWGIARLRLMLQIGMTFELEHNLESAQGEYQNARALCRAMLAALVEDGRFAGIFDKLEGELDDDRRHALKHLNILFQPLFADIWVAEKLGGGVDASIGLAERDLSQLREAFLYTLNHDYPSAEGPTQARHSSFSLIMAELHSKLGDLYFFKGRQVVHFKSLEAMRSTGKEGSGLHTRKEGYLLQAHRHYAITLHDLRRFTTYRRRSSPQKLNIWHEPWETIESGGWPDFIYRAAGGTFNDFAEVMLGRVSLYGMLGDLRNTRFSASRQWAPSLDNVRGRMELLLRACTEWMEGSSGAGRGGDHVIELPTGSRRSCGTLKSWLGEWKDEDAERKLVHYRDSAGHRDMERLGVSLSLMYVGARYLERGGYTEDAALEFLKIGEVVKDYLWWVLQVDRLNAWNAKKPGALNSDALALIQIDWSVAAFQNPYWKYLQCVAVLSLQKAGELYNQSRMPRKNAEDSLVGREIPPAAVTLVCGLALASWRWRKAGRSSIRSELLELLKTWKVTKADELKEDVVVEILKKSLVGHSYPMINRLNALRLLIDNAVLGSEFKRNLNLDDFTQVTEWLQELNSLAARLNAPLHFTPLRSGVTAALVWAWGKCEGEESWSDSVEKIHPIALRELLRSEEMSTMRRAHYASIINLYYLYDDFNDREVHFNRALQMAGLELVALLRGLLGKSSVWLKQRQSPLSPRRHLRRTTPLRGGLRAHRAGPAPRIRRP